MILANMVALIKLVKYKTPNSFDKWLSHVHIIEPYIKNMFIVNKTRNTTILIIQRSLYRIQTNHLIISVVDPQPI